MHRLDRDTAGCLVVALRRAALLAAQACFAEARVDRRYWAVVRPGPMEDAGLIGRALLKRSDPSGWRVVEDPAGQPARTAWRVLGRGGGMAWLELVPQTGRTHQLRVHCAGLGSPILGDTRYGGGEGAFHLLARSIAVPLDPPVAATAPVPGHMRAALIACGWPGEIEPPPRATSDRTESIRFD